VSTRFAVLADVHANVWALDAVLADAKQRGITEFVNLGDIVYGPLKPRETYERLRKENVLATISGNQDREIWQATPQQLAGNPTLAYVVREMDETAVRWLKELPATAVFGGEVLLCHGTPASDCTYFLEDVSSGRPLLRNETTILQVLGDVRQPIIACGHTHIARLVRLSSGQTIVNPGSVGLPAYDDDHPVPHAMENCSPHAAYAILEKNSSRWNFSFHHVAYDWDEAARYSRSLGLADWSYRLTTGRAGKTVS
jgi:predicted phosphodiesterase